VTPGSLPTCEHCGERPGACVGAYDEDYPSIACDECCGHGCEDGRCEALEEDWAIQVAAWLARAELRREDDRRST
jgi:hypothetical protein